MKHTIYITLNVIEDSGHRVIELPFSVEENIEDIVAFSFERRYMVKFNQLTWFTYPDAKDYVSGIEKAWISNKLDSYALYVYDNDFIDWLKERYEKDAMSIYKHRQEAELMDASTEAEMLNLIEVYSCDD